MLMRKQMILAVFIIAVAFGAESEFQIVTVELSSAAYSAFIVPLTETMLPAAYSAFVTRNDLMSRGGIHSAVGLGSPCSCPVFHGKIDFSLNVPR